MWREGGDLRGRAMVGAQQAQGAALITCKEAFSSLKVALAVKKEANCC